MKYSVPSWMKGMKYSVSSCMTGIEYRAPCWIEGMRRSVSSWMKGMKYSEHFSDANRPQHPGPPLSSNKWTCSKCCQQCQHFSMHTVSKVLY
jgi:hypothetical protein